MRTPRLAGSILALSVCGAAAHAQTTYPSPYPTAPSPYGAPVTVQPLSDADLLASELRLLAVDPQNLQALIRAGELALKLDDDTGAAAFFARAGRIDPRNARVKAGEGSLLVAAERPGDALRHFAEAQALGADPRSFAADRGLAYDLVGEQERAQRDYRLALKAGPNDETQRRYALSLGISGKRELALAQIDPLLRRSDRGAWRTRAFILAMAGDKAGAEKIATSMMPTGMAGGLQPFFEILPTLRPADRAFAVHFGEVRANPERMADARLVPPLAALGPDPTAPVVAATATRPLVVVDAREERRRAKAARKASRARGGEQMAALTTPPPLPLPAPPAYTGRPVVSAPAAEAYRPVVPAPVVLASNTVRLPPVVTPAPSPGAPVASYVQPGAPAAGSDAAARPVVVANAPTVARTAPVIAAQPIIVPKATTAPPAPSVTVTSAPAPAPVVVTPAAVPTPVPTPVAAAPLATTTVDAAPVKPTPTGMPLQPQTAPTQVPAQTPVVATPTPSPTPVRSEESILAAIIADIKVPGGELSAEPEPVTEPAPTPVKRIVAAKPVLPERSPVDQVALDKKAADKKAADKKAADKKALADKKAAEAKKLADAKKAAEEKKKKDPKVLEPSRFWVQVSGGANENDLPKQWAKVRTKSKAFGSKGGWTTPLRATNRILTGPFKTESEAQSFVNTIAKDGASGFVFVSDAGQKITKLAGK